MTIDHPSPAPTTSCRVLRVPSGGYDCPGSDSLRPNILRDISVWYLLVYWVGHTVVVTSLVVLVDRVWSLTIGSPGRRRNLQEPIENGPLPRSRKKKKNL